MKESSRFFALANCEDKNQDISISSVSNIKDPKHLQNYVEEAVESETYHSKADEENTV